MDNYQESYYKTVKLLEEKIEESDDLEMKIHWIKTYKEVVLEEDQVDELLDLTSDFTNALYSKDVNIYRFQIPESFMIEMQEELDWEIISSTQNLTREFITDNSELIDFSHLNLSNYMKLSNDDIRNLSSNINWSYISLRDDLSKEFIREFKDNVNWSYVTVNISFSEDEMEEFSEYLDWKMATICQVYSDEFKDKHDLQQYVDGMKSRSEKIIDSHTERVTSKGDVYGEDDGSREKFYEGIKDLIVESDKNNNDND